MKHSRAMSLLPKIELSPSFLRIRLPVKTVLPLPDHQDFLFPMVEQGITTVVIGNCGFSPAPDTIADNTTVTDTARRPTGIENIVINGEMVVDGGKYIKDKKAGQVVRFG